MAAAGIKVEAAGVGSPATGVVEVAAAVDTAVVEVAAVVTTLVGVVAISKHHSQTNKNCVKRILYARIQGTFCVGDAGVQ